jgi:hypothetical protein
MNERIKELERQAGNTLVDDPFGGVGVTFNTEKFAKLIVQDIINTALSKARWYQEVEKDDNTVMALCDLVKDIREEYGVE